MREGLGGHCLCFITENINIITHSQTGGNLQDSVLVIIYHFQLKTFSLARQTELLVLLEWKPF